MINFNSIRLSIIITSQHRPVELQRFFRSLNAQSDIDFSVLQIIFVDQGDNKPFFDILDGRIHKVYLKYHQCGLSEARNQALPYVKGEYISFGDDDSWYDKDIFSKVFKNLDGKLDGIGAAIKNEDDIPYNIYPKRTKRITYLNHCGVSSAGMFLRFDPTIYFDENIGVGSKLNLLSGEETDYLWTYMEKHPGFNIMFCPNITVRHPVQIKQNFGSHVEKSYYYARGFGYIMRKHPLPRYYIFKKMTLPFAGMIIHLLKGRTKAKQSFFILKGRLEGFFTNQNLNR